MFTVLFSNTESLMLDIDIEAIEVLLDYWQGWGLDWDEVAMIYLALAGCNDAQHWWELPVTGPAEKKCSDTAMDHAPFRVTAMNGPQPELRDPACRVRCF